MISRIAATAFLLVGICKAWLSQPHGHGHIYSRSLVVAKSTDNDFMESLRSRVLQINDRATKLPIVVIDTMLPRQILSIDSEDPVFAQLLQTMMQPTMDGSTCGVLGMTRTATGQTSFMKHGVEAEIVGIPRLTEKNTIQVKLRGGRRFELSGELGTSAQGWTEARVKFLDSNQQDQEDQTGIDPMSLANAMMKGRALKNGNAVSLINQWIELARKNERQPGQIDRLLEDLGEAPHSTSPTELAFWVGALINPLPGMGVALEIRPALLMATTANDRMDVVINGIRTSIKHMEGTERLW